MKFFIIIKDESVRVHDKNFRILGDKPLYKHLLDQLTDHDVYVNTDSERVVGDVTLIKRSKYHIEWENTKPDSPALSMIDQFLDDYVDDMDEVIVTTHVTSPFLKPQTMLKAAEYIGEYDSVMSVTEHREFAYVKRPSGYHPINFNPEHIKRTQDLDPIVFQNGAFFLFTKRSFKQHNNRVGSKPFYYGLSFPEYVEIDYEDDFKLAELIVRSYK